jgi:hypothetical protein
MRYITSVESTKVIKIAHFLHSCEDRKAKLCLTRLLAGYTSDHVSTIGQRFLHMEVTLGQQLREYSTDQVLKYNIYRMSKPLNNDSSILVDKKILDCVCVASADSRLGERPASSWRRVCQ